MPAPLHGDHGSLMKDEFTIQGVHYVVEFTRRHEFLFYVDAVHSERRVYEMTPFELAFGDEPPETIWTTTGTGHVFEVRCHVESFIDQVLWRFRPYYFEFSANQASKMSLYRRFAQRLCRRHGYCLAVGADGSTFRFDREAGDRPERAGVATHLAGE